MDNNNMNVVDFNNLENNAGQTPEPAQIPTMGPNPYAQPAPEPVQPMPEVGQVQMPEVEPTFEQVQVSQTPEVESTPVFGEVNQQPINQNIPMENNQEVPTIDVNPTPTEVFGAQVNEQPINNPNVQDIIPPTGPEEAVQPKYGYMTNEDKPNLNSNSNGNIAFIIFLAILMLGFIIALPYLSSMLG